jgi:hypothetical protein
MNAQSIVAKSGSVLARDRNVTKALGDRPT